MLAYRNSTASYASTAAAPEPIERMVRPSLCMKSQSAGEYSLMWLRSMMKTLPHGAWRSEASVTGPEPVSKLRDENPPANVFVFTKRTLAVAPDPAKSVEANSRRTIPGVVTEMRSSAPAEMHRFRFGRSGEVAPVRVMTPPVVSRRLSQYSLPAEAALIPPTLLAAVDRSFWSPASNSNTVLPADRRFRPRYTKFAPVTVTEVPMVMEGVVLLTAVIAELAASESWTAAVPTDTSWPMYRKPFLMASAEARVTVVEGPDEPHWAICPVPSP